MAHTLTNKGNSVTVYGRIAPVYIRTDKNGTMIYHDNNCQRCMGAGEADKWAFTGKVCFSCGGSGIRRKSLEVKVYTREYADKLEVRRAEKAAKEAAKAETNAPNEEELRRRADEARRNAWQSEGFNRDGIGYLYTGDTYKHRQSISDKNGRWNQFLRGWIAPVDLGPIQGVKIEQVTAADMCNSNGYIDPAKCWDR